jgi:hypothetical protein
MRYFIAPWECETPRQFADGSHPYLKLMPQGHMIDNSCEGQDRFKLDFAAHLAARHCKLFPFGFELKTDTTCTEYPPELELVIKGALESIAAAIHAYCPTIYLVETEQKESA